MTAPHKTGGFILVNVVLMVLAFAASTTRGEGSERLTMIGGRYQVFYQDLALGTITGTALISEDGKSATVKIKDPKSGKIYELASTSIKVDGDKYTIVLHGDSPSSPTMTGTAPRPNTILDQEAQRTRPFELPFVPQPMDASELKISAGGVDGTIAVGPQKAPEPYRVELHLRRFYFHGMEGVLSGMWNCAVDPLTWRDATGRGRIGFVGRDPHDPNSCILVGSEEWRPIPGPLLVATIPLDDQISYHEGRPNHGYPWAPDGLTINDRLGDTRLLFVVGAAVPSDFKKSIDLQSSEGPVGYSHVCLEKQPGLSPIQTEAFKKGWEALLRNSDPDTAQEARKLNAMLVQADLTRGVLPGMKTLSVNGHLGSWILRFGNDHAALSFARPAGIQRTELTDFACLPEQIQLELHTDISFPLDEVKLNVALNGTPVTFNGSAEIVAALDSWDKSRTIYRTPRIEILEAGKPDPPREPGVFYLHVKVTDTLTARVADPYLFTAVGPIPKATVIRTIADLGPTWDETLVRAAVANGITAPNFTALSAKNATEICNTIITAGKRVKMKVTVSEYAAMLSLRDEFVSMMREAEFAEHMLDAIPSSDAKLRAFRSALQPIAWDTASKWSYINVTGPDGRECPLAFALSDSYLAQHFTDPKAAEAWSLKAVGEGIVTYRKSVNDAIEKARAIPDDDVEELLKLTGTHFEAVAPQVMARLVSLRELENPRRLMWKADLNAIYSVQELSLLAEAVRAQREYSQLDSQMTMLAASAVTAPFMLGEGLVCTVVVYTADVANFGYSLLDIPEAIQQRTDIRFATGAALILGTDRVNEEELKKTEWFMVAGNAAASTFGWGLATGQTSKHIAKLRAAMMMERLEKGGMQAIRELSLAQKNQVYGALAEAVMLREAAGPAALSEMQQRCAALADRIEVELAGAAAKRNPAATIDAVGDAAIPVAEAAPSAVPEQVSMRAQTNPDKSVTWVPEETVVADDATNAALAGRDKTAVVEHHFPEVVHTEPPAPRPDKRVAPTEAHVHEPNKALSPTEPHVHAGDPTVEKTAKVPGGRDPNETAIEGPPHDPDATVDGPPPRPLPGESGAAKIAANPDIFRDAPAPFSDFACRTSTGETRTIKLGKLKSYGSYAWTYEILGDPNHIIKIYGRYDGFFTPEEVVENIMHGSELLAEGDRPILQAPITEHGLKGEQAYLVQEKIGGGKSRLIEPRIPDPRGADFPMLRNPEAIQFFTDPQHQQAVMDLFAQLADKGLIWEDCHMGNMFFVEQADGTWKAGILDSDRICKFSDRSGKMGSFMCEVEMDAPARGIRSLVGSRFKTPLQIGKQLDNAAMIAPYFVDPHFFMSKMFEYKGWVVYDVFEQKFKPGWLNPELIQQGFPEMKLAPTPLDLTIPNHMRLPPGAQGCLPRSMGLPLPAMAWINPAGVGCNGGRWAKAA